MKINKIFRKAILTTSILMLTITAFANGGGATVRCTRYTGSFSFGEHYVEWGFTICDNPDANTSWFDVYHAA